MENVPPNKCITLEELKRLMKGQKKSIKIIDVRNREEYDEQHIPGAINIVISQIDKANELFDKSDSIITVCGKGGGRSADAAERIKQLGFKNSNWLCGGTFGWYK